MFFYLPPVDFMQNNELKKQIIRHLIAENKILETYLEFLLKKIPHIGTYEMRGVNKLRVLYEAVELGLEVPDTQIVGEKIQIDHVGKMITKCISETFTPTTEKGRFVTYTEALNYKHLKKTFFPSLFQSLIEKEADIRIFFLRNRFYSMAIQSQDHPQTKIDFRKYLAQNSNRHLTFKIPLDIQQKLIKLMNKIELETASIDMVFTKDGRFVFLEANPIGQFGMTSKPCNYFLEREVALALIQLSKSNLQ
jgi:ATP-GRASP peptide maturase of grasp-with-spasm system